MGLLTVIYISIDPLTKIKNARNVRRFNDVNTILTSVSQFVLDKGDIAFKNINEVPVEIGTCSGCVNLATVLTGKYLKDNLTDPSGGTVLKTGYTIAKANNGMYIINAVLSEGITIMAAR